jgi:hypothetical protein
MQTLINSKQIENYLIKELGMENLGGLDGMTCYGKDTGDVLVFFIFNDTELGVFISLTIGDTKKNTKKLFKDYIKTPEEFNKVANLAKSEIEKYTLKNLGVADKGEPEYSEREIRDMIDVALDNRDYAEVDRLNKMLPEEIKEIKSLVESIKRIKKLMI